jgi:ribosome-associated toxin RatA of RatAB toxin-antitoxin module
LRRFPIKKLKQIANTYSIEYRIFNPRAKWVLSTKMSRLFKVSRDGLYNIVADINNHEELFSQVWKSKIIDRQGLEDALSENEVLVVSHLNEGRAGSRACISKYVLDSPKRITQFINTNPFRREQGGEVEDSKCAEIRWTFDTVSDDSCRLTCESTFRVSTGKIYAREFTDHLWLNFFENLMVKVGELRQGAMLTDPLGKHQNANR